MLCIFVCIVMLFENQKAVDPVLLGDLLSYLCDLQLLGVTSKPREAFPFLCLCVSYTMHILVKSHDLHHLHVCFLFYLVAIDFRLVGCDIYSKDHVLRWL